ncbi:MAG TPA: DJ-1/PfpI family protein [Acidimicrobiales bacterium]|nr:DJ-1/PfpI family protein [Acidimicrobiales bacterium]
MQIVCLVFDGVTALDAVGPYEVLSRLPGATFTFVGPGPGTVRTDNGVLGLVVDGSIDDAPAADVLVVPGGIGTRRLVDDDRVVDWVRATHATTMWTTSVCTGSLVLGAAGILEGLDATTHWTELESLAGFGARPVASRVVERGKIITAAGVSAGIDMALVLAARIGGEFVAQAIQLGIEYDPQPPYDAGSPDKAPREAVELVRTLMATATNA